MKSEQMFAILVGQFAGSLLEASRKEAGKRRIMNVEQLARHGVHRGLSPLRIPVGWGLGALSARLVELSGGPATAVLTMTFRLVHEAQVRGEPVAWITAVGSTFFPVDAVANGIDLEALAVIRLKRRLLAARAADQLVRSGGFGLVVLDPGGRIDMPLPIQSRLAGLAKKHHTALVVLTGRSSDLPSLGPLVSLRIEVLRRGAAGDGFGCEVRVLRDKWGGVGWRHTEVCRGPEGLYPPKRPCPS